MGVIVLTSSVCVCVTTLTTEQTYGPEFRHVGQVEGYVGQVQRSRSPGQIMFFRAANSRKWAPLMKMPRKQLRNMSVQIRRGVFSKRMRFFFHLYLFAQCMVDKAFQDREIITLGHDEGPNPSFSIFVNIMPQG